MTHRFKIEASFAKSFSNPLELRVYAGTNRDDSIIFRGKAASDLYEILTGDLSIAKKKEDMMDDKTINKKYLGEVTDITEGNFNLSKWEHFDPQTMEPLKLQKISSMMFFNVRIIIVKEGSMSQRTSLWTGILTGILEMS